MQCEIRKFPVRERNLTRLTLYDNRPRFSAGSGHPHDIEVKQKNIKFSSDEIHYE
jgi:hypothetical protein